MELAATPASRKTASLIAPLARRATACKAIAALAAAALFGATLMPTAWGVQQEGEDTVDRDGVGRVEPSSGLGFQAGLATGEVVGVYPADRNQADDAIENHVYLYLPPLTPQRDSDGRVTAFVTPSGRVRVLLRGTSLNITSQLHNWLADRGDLPDTTRSGSRSVRPLPYDQIRIVDADDDLDARWEAVYPPPETTPVLQEWLPFVFTPREGVSESADEFIARWNDPNRLPSLRAVVNYGGRTTVLGSVIVNASALRTTDFLVDLKGEGQRDLVTRDQARELVSKYVSDVSQRTYRESSDAVSLDDGWLDNGLFQRVTMSADEFWSNEVNLRRVGFSGDDLSPDRHREMRERTARELRDTTNDKLSEETSSYWKLGSLEASAGSSISFFGIEASWNGSVATPSFETGRAERLDKEMLVDHLESEDSSFEWNGEVIIPKDVVLYQVDEARLDTDIRLASISVLSSRASGILNYVIYNSEPQAEADRELEAAARRIVPVGTIVASTTEPTIVHRDSPMWHLADGSPVLDEWRYSGTHLPDLRGTFVRGINYGKQQGEQGHDPAGARVPGHFQHSSTGPPMGFTVSVSEAGSHSHIHVGPRGDDRVDRGSRDSLVSDDYVNRSTDSAGVHSHDVEAAGWDAETRPSNVAVYFYIRVK